MPQGHNTPSLYEMLTGNFSGGLSLHRSVSRTGDFIRT